MKETFALTQRALRWRALRWKAGWLWILPAALLLASTRGSQSVRGKIQGVVIPIFLPGEGPASAVLSIEAVRSDYQRKAFFRIGILPEVVVEGVQIRFKNLEDRREILARAAESLISLGKNSPVIVRRVSIHFPGEVKPRLRIAEVHFAKTGVWRLIGVERTEAQKTSCASEGTLHISGERAGKVKLQTAQEIVTFDLFADENDK